VIVGRLIPAGTGLTYHETRTRQEEGEDMGADMLFEADGGDHQTV
jgi:hypothetical protein